jgi:uncharacterized membrane protein
MSEKTRKLAIAGMLTGVMLLLEVTGLGYPEIPPFAVTIMQVPVAVGAIMLGPWFGFYFGGLFGLTSMWHAARSGMPAAFIFLDLRVALIPRLLVPFAAYLVFRLFNRLFKEKNKLISGVLGGVAASLTNTVFVLGAIYLFYAAQAMPLFGADNSGMLLKALVTVAVTSGLVEAVVAGVLCGPIVAALSRTRKE